MNNMRHWLYAELETRQILRSTSNYAERKMARKQNQCIIHKVQRIALFFHFGPSFSLCLNLKEKMLMI